MICKKNKLYLYIVIGLIAFGYRVYVNFNQELILGVNGGYYPLQVRSILENGKMGFSDMPLLFYLNAGILKFILLFGTTVSDTLILNVVKMVDCFSIPLLLLPLYKIIKFQSQAIPLKLELGIILFSVLSISPLILVADLQKNALAITFLFIYIAYLWQYFKLKRNKQIIIAVIFLILTGLTHFGTFVVVLLFGLISLGYVFRKKAIIPLIITSIFSLLLIGIFDYSRFYRLITISSEVFSNSALLTGMISPPDILNIIFSYLLAIFSLIILQKKGNDYLNYQKGFIISCIILLITLSFPLLEGQYFRRLSLFLFIPQILILILLAPQLKKSTSNWISYFLIFFTFISVLMMMGRPKETVIDVKSLADLKSLNSLVKKDDKTIIIAKHGLEWWTAWALHTKVGQEKSIDEEFYEKYDHIYFLHQNNKKTNEREHLQFPEPKISNNSELIYSSDFFKLYALFNRK